MRLPAYSLLVAKASASAVFEGMNSTGFDLSSCSGFITGRNNGLFFKKNTF